jgi:hypothetical protein
MTPLDLPLSPLLHLAGLRHPLMQASIQSHQLLCQEESGSPPRPPIAAPLPPRPTAESIRASATATAATALLSSDGGSPARKRLRRSISNHRFSNLVGRDSSEAQPGMSGAASEADARWSGTVKLPRKSEEGLCVDLCSISLQLPRSVVGDLPSTLHVSHIKSRQGIQLHGQATFQTGIGAASEQRQAQLMRMAQLELVAVMPLPRPNSSRPICAVLVPYLSSRTGDLKAVTLFLEQPAAAHGS